MPDILLDSIASRPALNATNDGPVIEPAPAAPETPMPAAPAAKPSPDIAAAVQRLESLGANPDKAALAEAAGAVSAAWSSRVAEAGPEVQKVVEDPSLPITPTMAGALLQSDDPVAVALWLGRNPAEAARISRLPEARQSFAIGKIAGAKPATPTRQQSAPAPAARQPREESMEAYFTRRTKEIQSNRAPMFGTVKGGTL